MIYEHEFLAYNPQIDFVGFNIQSGGIVSEKIYYKKTNSQNREYYSCPVLKRLSESIPDLRFFSAETYHADYGVIKYDFQVESSDTWVTAKDFLNKNIESYNSQVVSSVEKISWLRTQFTTLSFRVYKNQQILNTVLYYQRPPASAARIDCHFAHLVPPLAAAQCTALKKQSKKNQRKFHAAKRGTWNGVSLVTRIVQSKRLYDRNRAKQEDRRDED